MDSLFRSRAGWLTVLLLTLPMALPGAAADGEVVIARGAFVAQNGEHVLVGTVELVRLGDAGHALRFAGDFRFEHAPPAPVAPVIQALGGLHFDVRILSSAEPTNAESTLAQTPVPGLLGKPDAVLGGLQSRVGAQSYAIASGTDVAQVQSAVVHCADFQLIMGTATLAPV